MDTLFFLFALFANLTLQFTFFTTKILHMSDKCSTFAQNFGNLLHFAIRIEVVSAFIYDRKTRMSLPEASYVCYVQSLKKNNKKNQ